jgi:hypothetical protein
MQQPVEQSPAPPEPTGGAAEDRARLAKAVKHAKRAIAAYRRTQERLAASEADLAAAERDLEEAEAGRTAAEERAVAAEARASAAEAALADIRRQIAKGKAMRKIEGRLRKLGTSTRRAA